LIGLFVRELQVLEVEGVEKGFMKGFHGEASGLLVD
jgi:hypothetical protein